MELQEFIASALTQIIKGVALAQTNVADCGASVNPIRAMQGAKDHTPYVRTEDGDFRVIETIRFDVAVTVSDNQQAGAGAGIKVFGASLGASGKVAYENSSVSRVSFEVPVALPCAVVLSEKKAADQARKEFTKDIYAGFRNR